MSNEERNRYMRCRHELEKFCEQEQLPVFVDGERFSIKALREHEKSCLVVLENKDVFRDETQEYIEDYLEEAYAVA